MDKAKEEAALSSTLEHAMKKLKRRLVVKMQLSKILRIQSGSTLQEAARTREEGRTSTGLIHTLNTQRSCR